MFERSHRLVPVLLTSMAMALPLAAAPGVVLGQERVVCDISSALAPSTDVPRDIVDVGFAGLTDQQLDAVVMAQQQACRPELPMRTQRAVYSINRGQPSMSY